MSLSLDDDDHIKVAKVEHLYFIYEENNKPIEDAYRIPLKHCQHCVLFKVALESAIAKNSTDIADYCVKLIDSTKLISLKMLNYIFKGYLSRFAAGEQLPTVIEGVPNYHPLVKCERTSAFLNDFYIKEGFPGLSQLSYTSMYLDIPWLTNCIADRIAMELSGLTPQEIYSRLIKK